MVLFVILGVWSGIFTVHAVQRLDKNERCLWFMRHKWRQYDRMEEKCANCGKYRLYFGHAFSDVYNESLKQYEEEQRND